MTLQMIEEYERVIGSTTQDLANILRDVNAKLESLGMKATPPPLVGMCQPYNEPEKRWEFCAEVLARIYLARLRPAMIEGSDDLEDKVEGLSLRKQTMADLVALTTLEERRNKFSDAKHRLPTCEGKATDHLSTGLDPTETDYGRDTLQSTSELNSTTPRFSTCSNTSERATPERTYIFEDITVGRDGKQMLISTHGGLFNARRVTAGDRALQLIGPCSDTTIQACVRNCR